MSLGFTQLKATASKKLSCSEASGQFPEKSAYCMCAVSLSAGGGQHKGQSLLQRIK